MTLLVDKEDGLGAELAATKACQIAGSREGRSYVVIVLDVKSLCEAGTQARYRLPPTRPAQVQRLIKAVLEARGGSLGEGDIVVCLDAGKDNVEPIVLRALGMQKSAEIARHLVVYTQDSCEGRLQRSSQATLDVTERAVMISTEPLFCKARVPNHERAVSVCNPIFVTHAEVPTAEASGAAEEALARDYAGQRARTSRKDTVE